MINTKQKQITALKEELESTNEKLNATTEKLNAACEELEEMKQEKEADEHANVQQSLIGEFQMSQEEFNAKLVEGMMSPAVTEYMGRMLSNAMAMGLGR